MIGKVNKKTIMALGLAGSLLFGGIAANAATEQEIIKPERKLPFYKQEGAKQFDAAAKEEWLTKKKEAMEARLNEAVKNGAITEEKAQELKEKFSSNNAFAGKAKKGFKVPKSHKGLKGEQFKGPALHFEQVTAILNMDAKALMEELRAGKSLAEISESKGVAREQLKNILLEQMNGKLDKAVEAGKIPADKVEEIKSKFAERADTMLDKKKPQKS